MKDDFRPVKSAIHPELVQPLKRVPAFSIHHWSIPILRILGRFLQPKSNLEGVEISERTAGETRLRILRPADAEPTGTLLWMHGGGLILGTPAQEDGRCAEFVRTLGLVVISTYYRLAPQNPYPAALDDCHSAWNWLQANLDEFGLEPSRVAIGGGSAGAGLAASLSQRLYDEGGPQPAGQLLVYPMLDDRTAARRELDAEKHPIWNNTSNLTGWSSYLGDAPGVASTPEYAVPARRADLRGLPPAWIGVGTLDLFLAESRTYAKRLEEAGVVCRFDEVPGAVHGFDGIAPDASISKQFLNGQLSFLRECLALPAA